MSQLFTMLTVAAGLLAFASGWMKVSECRNGVTVEPPPHLKDHIRALLLGVSGSVQALAGLGLVVPLLLRQGTWLIPISALTLVVVLALSVLPASLRNSDHQGILVLFAPAAFIAYTWLPGGLGVPFETDERG